MRLWKKDSEFLILYELFHVLYALLTGGVFVVFADFQVLVVKDSFVGMGIILKDLDNPVGIEEMIFKKIGIALSIRENLLNAFPSEHRDVLPFRQEIFHSLIFIFVYNKSNTHTNYHP